MARSANTAHFPALFPLFFLFLRLPGTYLWLKLRYTNRLCAHRPLKKEDTSVKSHQFICSALTVILPLTQTEEPVYENNKRTPVL